MPKKKILIAPNSFKECLDAVNISRKIYENLKIPLKNYELIQMPLSDGGDGFLENIKFNNKTIELSDYIISTYEGDYIRVPAVISEQKLFIESADVVGLKLHNPGERQPMNINTFPLGELLYKLDSHNRSGILNIKEVVLGIGGTATNDLGLGVCQVFGLKLLSDELQEIPVVPSQFRNAKKIIWNKPLLSFNLKLVLDVNIPLTGEMGSAALFAKQKGADETDLPILEEGFLNILRLINQQGIFTETENLPGAGGGLAAGLLMFFDAIMITSREFIEEQLDNNQIPVSVDYLITGEGSFDDQSFYGKSTGVIIAKFPNAQKFIICGVFKSDPEAVPENLRVIELIKYFNSREDSIKNFDNAIKLACREIISEIRREV